MELKYFFLNLTQLNADISKLKEEVSKRDEQLLQGKARWVDSPTVT